MFIFEYLWKLVAPKKNNENEFAYDPLREEIKDDDEEEFCKHDFRPIDSTNETLACIKCGFIVKRSNIIEDNYESNIK